MPTNKSLSTLPNYAST